MFELPATPGFTTAFPGLPTGKPAAASRRRQAEEFRATLRRKAQLKAAAEVLPHLPQPGQETHTLLTGSFDFALVLTCVIQSRPVRCDDLTITTLAFSRRNTAELAKLLDSGKVGRLTLLCSDFMAKSNASIYQGAVEELVDRRGQTVASSRCHSKTALLAFADGMRLIFSGSMNLRTNKNVESMIVLNDPEPHDLYSWYAGWIQERVSAG